MSDAQETPFLQYIREDTAAAPQVRRQWVDTGDVGPMRMRTRMRGGLRVRGTCVYPHPSRVSDVGRQAPVLHRTNDRPEGMHPRTCRNWHEQ